MKKKKKKKKKEYNNWKNKIEDRCRNKDKMKL